MLASPVLRRGESEGMAFPGFPGAAGEPAGRTRLPHCVHRAPLLSAKSSVSLRPEVPAQAPLPSSMDTPWLVRTRGSQGTQPRVRSTLGLPGLHSGVPTAWSWWNRPARCRSLGRGSRVTEAGVTPHPHSLSKARSGGRSPVGTWSLTEVGFCWVGAQQGLEIRSLGDRPAP